MDNIKPELINKISTIRLLLMDVDGTLSDGRLYYSADCVESKSFDVTDGFGIYLFNECGLKTGIITGRESKIVTERAKELQIDIVYQGRYRKDQVLREIMQRTGLSESQIAYIGDDLFDLPLLIKVGFSAAPGDAHPEVKSRVHYVCEHLGGRGAVREVIELVLKIQGRWEAVLEQFLTSKRD
jgi:3-deoxy-D-manno-octulosonate 8-phosphate phosphatase (KDO 8-P phosphatase)